MNGKAIKQALKCHSAQKLDRCFKCPYHKTCCAEGTYTLASDAFAYIKYLQKKNARLSKKCKALKTRLKNGK